MCDEIAARFAKDAPPIQTQLVLALDIKGAALIASWAVLA
jgi:hypothetical protein